MKAKTENCARVMCVCVCNGDCHHIPSGLKITFRHVIYLMVELLWGFSCNYLKVGTLEIALRNDFVGDFLVVVGAAAAFSLQLRCLQVTYSSFPLFLFLSLSASLQMLVSTACACVFALEKKNRRCIKAVFQHILVSTHLRTFFQQNKPYCMVA